MTAPPFHLAGPSITHSGHCSRDKSNYVLTHQLLHSSPSAGEKNIHTNYAAKTTTTPIAHIWECWEDRVPCSAGWRGDVLSLGKNKSRKKRQHPSKGCRDRAGDKDREGQGVQSMWLCTPPQSTRDCPSASAWSGAQQKMLHTQNSAEV